MAELISAQLLLSESYVELGSRRWSPKLRIIDLNKLRLKLLRLDAKQLRCLVLPTSGAPVRNDADYGTG